MGRGLRRRQGGSFGIGLDEKIRIARAGIRWRFHNCPGATLPDIVDRCHGRREDRASALYSNADPRTVAGAPMDAIKTSEVT
jgi:hypothetical protein